MPWYELAGAVALGNMPLCALYAYRALYIDVWKPYWRRRHFQLTWIDGRRTWVPKGSVRA